MTQEWIDLSRPCIEWRGCTNAYGYGVVHHKGKVLQVHRVAYEARCGPIPPGLVIDHLCRNSICMNPAHMEPVTRGENVRRGFPFRTLRERCKRGHEYDRRDNLGRKVCLACQRIRYHESRNRKAVA